MGERKRGSFTQGKHKGIDLNELSAGLLKSLFDDEAGLSRFHEIVIGILRGVKCRRNGKVSFFAQHQI